MKCHQTKLKLVSIWYIETKNMKSSLCNTKFHSCLENDRIVDLSVI